MQLNRLFSKKISLWVLWIIIVLGIYIIVQDYLNNLREKKIFEDSAKIPVEFWDEKYKDMPIKDYYKVVYVVYNGGEYSAAKYFQYAAQKKGWEIKLYYQSIVGKENEILNFDPDFIIFPLLTYTEGVDSRIKTHRSKKYYWIPMPLELIRKFEGVDKKDLLKPQGWFKHWLSFADGLIITNVRQVDIYRQISNLLGKPFNAVSMLPAPPANNYTVAEPKKIIWPEAGWDQFRSSKKYKRFISLLSQNVPMRVYGHYKNLLYLPAGIYGGYIPHGLDNITAIRKNGIYLLTHSKEHFESNFPSMRPFEAAASNVITISDMHPFIIEHFGDSMLYFDQNASAEEMYTQVKKHVDWILANPDKAKEKAKLAHKIFLEKFTVDKDLIRIAKMHEYILKQEKNMSLDYNLVY
ncbi:hypothetical protein phytr_4010 [Candidatus Phycorickettsia trachydisci]|uniref:Spore protein YkvP/CgeB glycosyl transferase-like domain-containing protein n=1 Tax=Candidatus Phycorickettsia trachydisci TaxID=2115978 RepID=A0A2P1P7W4_9RICK|nr:glycosyltransferase [Candidatus Phycorickettsia trachydisci]AVP87352.1 hypothetical protein phytr_4010 [Candidatus Phycorickettsia trachydisci]